MQTNHLKHKHGQRKPTDAPKNGVQNKGNLGLAANGNQQHPGVSQHRYCRLVHTDKETFKFQNLDEANRIYQFEDAYLEFTRRCPDDTSLKELLLKERDFHRLVSRASVFAFLANSPDSTKYLNYLCAASEIDQGEETLVCMNRLIFDGFTCITHEVRLRLVHLLEFLMSNHPKNLDNIVTNYFRELNGGNCIGSTEEVVKLLGSTAEMFIRKKEWFRQQNAILLSCVFATFSRVLSDLPPMYERVRQLLIHCVDYILREHFGELISMMGSELILAIQRNSKTFPHYWKTLIHQPENLLPNFQGIPQLLSTRCSPAFNSNRIAFRLQFCLDRILLYRPDVLFSFHFEWLSADYLNGFDACSLRAEIIRFAINNQKYQSAEQIKQSRNAFFVYLITSAIKRNIADSQISKLALIFDCLCADRENNGGSVLVLEPLFMVIRYLLDKQSEVGNSMLELIIRTTLDFHPKFSTQIYSNVSNFFRRFVSTGAGVQTLIENRQLDKNLRLALAEFLPELYGRQPADPNTPSPSSRINELESESRMILEQASNDPKTFQKNEKRKLRASKSSDLELDQIRRGLLDEELKRETKTLEELIPNLNEQFRQPVEKLRQAVDSQSIEDEARQLFILIKETAETMDKAQMKLLASCVLSICARYLKEKQFYTESEGSSEQLDSPIFVLFDQIYKSKSFKLTERRVWLQFVRQMAKQESSIGYLFLYFLAKNPNKNNRIEASSYYEFVEVMKSTNRERLCQDMSICSIDSTPLFSFLLPYVFASFNEASGCPSLIESICVTLDEHQVYKLASHMYSRGDISLFKKDTFTEIFRTSLNWNTHAQNTFWQLVRVDNVAQDWIFDNLSTVKESKHPIVCLNVLNALQYMEVDISPSIVRGLFSKFSEDNFTLNLLNLILTDTEIQNQMAQRLAALMKNYIKKEEFYRPTKATASAYSNLQTSFEHLQKIALMKTPKKGSLVQGLIKTEPILAFYRLFKKNEKFEDMQRMFDGLFSVWQTIETESNNKANKPGKGRKLNDQPETKAKKPKVVYELSDEDD